jgi:hypothetical protein
LIIDLKNLLEGRPPVIGREGLRASTMESLAEGDETDEVVGSSAKYNAVFEDLAGRINRSRALITILAALLGVAVISNLLLIAAR